MDVRRALRQARLEAGLSQRQLAAWAGVGASMVSRYESGAASPSLQALDRLLEACGRDVRLVLVERYADLHDEFRERAALDWRSRLTGPHLGRSALVRRLLDAGCPVLVAGGWAALLHGVAASYDTEGLLLLGERDVPAFVAANRPPGCWVWPRRLVDGEYAGVQVTAEVFADGGEQRWEQHDGGRFTTRVVREGDPWPAEVRVDTEAGPLRVLAPDLLEPQPGVEPDVLEVWQAWRRAAAT